MIRKILQESVCHRCSNGSEDVLHSLWSCDGLKEVWNVDFGWVNGSGTQLNFFSELLKTIQTKPHLVALFAATAWSIWYHRNKIRLDEASMPLGKIAGFARDYIHDFKNLTSIPPCLIHTAPRRWCPPAVDVWKVDFDGAMFGESDEAGI